jgi:hypothetical protein
MLTPAQKRFLETLGYLVFRQAFSPPQLHDHDDRRGARRRSPGNYESALKWAQTNSYGAPGPRLRSGLPGRGGPRRQAMLKRIVEWGFR